MAALDFPAAPSDGQTYSPAGSSITYTYSSAKGSWQGSLSGTAGSVPTTITLAATNTTNSTHYPLFAEAATGNEEPRTDTGLTYNPSSGLLTSTTFAGNLTGDVTGTIQTASQTNITGVGTIATGVWSATAIDDSYIASSGTWNAKQDALTFGIANTYSVVIDHASVADDDYAKFTSSGLEGRSYSEVLSDIGAQASLTFGIANTNSVVIDHASVVDDDYAKFTSSGLEGKSFSEVKTDLSLGNVEDTALSTWGGTVNLATLGTVTAGTWEGNTVGSQYGGTGQNFSSSTGVAIVTTGTFSVQNPLVETLGGTGETSYTTGDILYASGSNTLDRLAVGSNTHVLTLSGGLPTWAAAGGGGGTPGGSSSQLQYNNSSSFAGMSQFTYSDPDLSVTGGNLNIIATSSLKVDASVIKFEGSSATQDPSNTVGMHWYDGTYRMHIRPKAWADNNDIDNAIVLPTWGVDLNMFSQRNKKDLRDHSITHNTSNGKYIYMLTDEFNRQNHSTSTDRYSILIGHDVERGNQSSSADANISMGYQTSYNMGSGTKNIHLGWKAGYGSGGYGGSNNIHIGTESGYDSTHGDSNIFMGYRSSFGTKNTSSDYNIGIGYEAFYQEENTAAEQYNIAIGYQAAYGEGYGNNSYRSYNTDENVAIGRNVMYNGFPGDKNVAIGKYAMWAGTHGSQSQNNPDRNSCNIAIGEYAMAYMKSGTYYSGRTPSEFGRQYNVALGYYAGHGYDSTTEGLDAFGVYIGYEAGYNIRGLDNVDSDTSDQQRNTRGSKNVFIGYRAGKDVTFGKGNVIIGGHTGTAGTSFNNEVHIYAGDTERMKIDSDGLSVNGAAVGGGAPSHTSFGFENFRGQDNCNARLSHRREETNQEDYPSTSSKFLNWGWYNASVSGYIGDRLFIVPAVGDSGSVVVYDDDTSTYGKQSFTWADVEGNHNGSYNGLYVDVSNVAMNVYLSYRSGQSASNGQRWRAVISTNNPQWDSANGIWKSSDFGTDYNGTWIGTYSGEDNATRDSSHYNAWQPQGPINSGNTPDYTSKPACTSYASTYHFRERIIERDSQHGHLSSYWQDSAMPPGAQGNSTTAGDWLTWTSTATSWTHVYDHYQFGGGSEYWTGDIHFHPRFDTRIEIECDLHWMADADDSQVAWALGAIIMDRDYYSNGWSTGTSGFQWLTDYADKDKYHGSRHSSSHSNALNYTRLSRTLHVNSAANQSNYQWNCREATDRKPWTIGLFNKISAGTVYLKQFKLSAKFYA